MIISILTLYEMKADRSAAYRPDISFADTVLAVCWDENGQPVLPEEDTMRYILPYIGSEDSINAAVPLQMYNIGVGTAKDVSLTWNQEENLKVLAACFDELGGVEIDTCPTCGEVFGSVHGFPPEEIRYDFMRNAADGCNTIYLPQLYLDYLIHYASKAAVTENYPVLTLTAEFTDVQGTRYSQTVTLTFELIVGGWGEENYSVFRLHFTEI